MSYVIKIGRMLMTHVKIELDNVIGMAISEMLAVNVPNEKRFGIEEARRFLIKIAHYLYSNKHDMSPHADPITPLPADHFDTAAMNAMDGRDLLPFST